MAAHSGTLTTVVSVQPDQPVAGWPAWLREIAAGVNLLGTKTTEIATAPPVMSGMVAGQLPVAATATSVTSSVALPLAVALGGTADTGTAWTSYVPTLSVASGALTSATATGRYKLLGKTCFIEITVNITTNGTAAASLSASLPAGISAAGFNYVLAGREFAVAGYMLQGLVGATITILKYDNAYPGLNGAVLAVNGVFETT